MKFPINNIGVTLSELPGEVAVYVEFAACNMKCKGCHSPHLWNDSIPNAYLSPEAIFEEIRQLMFKYGNTITAIVLMGGTTNDNVTSSDIKYLIALLSHKTHLPVGLYSGQDEDLDRWLDVRGLEWLKTGSYMKENGGLEAAGSNQKFYHKETARHSVDAQGLVCSVEYHWVDITSIFQKGAN